MHISNKRAGLGRIGAAVAAAALLAASTACSSSDASSGSGKPSSDNGSDASQVQVHLGYFPNLTHATAIIGDNKGYFADALGNDNATVQTQQFDSGTEAIQALLSGGIDATYIGPSPTITAYAQSHGEAVRVIAGATSGGASLVVKPSIKSAKDLRGAKLGTPGLANTQDIALRYYLKQHGYKTTEAGGGDVSVLPQDSNSTAVQAFASGNLDGAWLPEPYATQMVQDAHGVRLVNERSLWPNGKFVTTQLLVSTTFMDEHPDLVKDMLSADLQANDFIQSNPDQAKQVVAAGLKKLTGSAVDPTLLDAAWKELTFTPDPIASSLVIDAKHAEAVGLLEPIDLKGLYDLGPLNALLKSRGEAPVPAP